MALREFWDWAVVQFLGGAPGEVDDSTFKHDLDYHGVPPLEEYAYKNKPNNPQLPLTSTGVTVAISEAACNATRQSLKDPHFIRYRTMYAETYKEARAAVIKQNVPLLKSLPASEQAHFTKMENMLLTRANAERLSPSYVCKNMHTLYLLVYSLDHTTQAHIADSFATITGLLEALWAYLMFGTDAAVDAEIMDKRPSRVPSTIPPAAYFSSFQDP